MKTNTAESYLRFVPKKDSEVVIDIPNGTTLDRPTGGQISNGTDSNIFIIYTQSYNNIYVFKIYFFNYNFF